MTLGKEVEQDVKDTQKRQQQPFQIVLVDIKKAAENEVIHCVKTPLVVEEGKTEALKYIALSYRWGELQETLVDTKVGYIATLTSFSLNDFYQLCRMMTIESDTKHIQYVWVDAICVDQSHYRRRKETIYQMSNIYERASYILAIPDLHLTFLKGTSMKINDLLKQSMHLIKDLYYLLHGNVDKMAAIETTFLDELNVPKDPALRQLLTQWTDHFVTGFMNYKKHHVGYIDAKALDHIYETSGTAKTNNMDNYTPYRFHTDTYKVMDDAFSFFKFDFDDPSFASILNSDIYLTESNTYITRKSSSNPVYIQFHYTMIRQLKQQSFLEMMLSSKASKNGKY
ncbi:hypothetical protein BCR42DRAFT_397718 [Absidia repens]|uniref:Heterokaryon incompatibility domain-containing protein n=1 Tax=Absidia repens TaxID=90262 RepID=A0A1X2HZW5_9FUNG|nr:hypothetical protein BCR42DRAFT_397718 [Absidia repens]